MSDGLTDQWIDGRTDIAECRVTYHATMFLEGVTSRQKNYAATFDLNKRLKLVQLLTLSKKTYGFTCVIANPKPLFAP